jgi:hypothetical protein
MGLKGPEFRSFQVWYYITVDAAMKKATPKRRLP